MKPSETVTKIGPIHRAVRSPTMDYYIIGCCLLTWIGISTWGILLIRRTWRFRYFVPAPATITHIGTAEVPTIPSTEFDNSQTSTVLRFSYKFEVDGQLYGGTDEGGYFEYSSTDGKKKRPLYLGKKGQGDEIEIYYNPKDPRENSHRRNLAYVGFVILGAGQLFLLLTINLVNDWL